MEITKASHRDAEKVSALLLAAFNDLRPLYTDGGFESTVLSPDKVRKRMDAGITWIANLANPAGTVSAIGYPDGLYICGMAVHPSFRNQGLGERLLRVAERHALENGFAKIFLSTAPFLRSAIALYERFGFTKVNKPPFDLAGTPLISMEKRL